MLIQLIANGIVLSSLYALVALGFGLVYNTTRILHIAHGAIYTVSSYLFYLFLIQMKLPFIVALLFSLLLTSFLGVLIEFIVYRPLELKKASSLMYLISSLGLYTILVNLIALIWGNETKILRPGVEETVRIGSVILTRIQLVQFLAGVVIIACLFLFFKHSRTGKLIRAFADNRVLAEVVGINIWKLRAGIFGVSSFLAGVASILNALDVGMDPNVGMSVLLIAMVAVIIGGVKVTEASVAGAFVIGILQSLVIWKFSARWVEAVVFSLLIVFLLIRPQGLFGRKLRVETKV